MTKCSCEWKDDDLRGVCAKHFDMIQTNKSAFIAGYKLGHVQQKVGGHCYPLSGYNQWQEMMRKGNNTL